MKRFSIFAATLVALLVLLLAAPQQVSAQEPTLSTTPVVLGRDPLPGHGPFVSMSVEAVADINLLRFSTHQEEASQITGYHIYRQNGNLPPIQLTEEQIPAQGDNDVKGYSYEDSLNPNGNHRYYVAAFRANGDYYMVGPCAVGQTIVFVPTAVSLSDFSAENSSPWSLWLGVGLVAVVWLLLTRR